MSEYMFYIFSVIVFFILVRESIIDIKTMYVPDNITFAIYTTSILFLAFSWFTTDSFQIIKDGFFGFLLGFGVPFIISFCSYIIQLFFHKRQKKDKQCQTVITTEKQITFKKENKENTNTSIENINIPSKWPIKRILYWFFCFILLFVTSAVQTIMPQLTYLSIGISFLIAIIISYEKTKKIDYPIYLTAIGMLVMALWAKKNIVLLPLTIGAMLIEMVLAKIFQRFYKIEPETVPDNNSQENIEGGIGGGDILIFGALGLMFGLKGIIVILLYSLFSQLLVILSYAFLSPDKSFTEHIPFVPGIAIGTYLYIMGFDILNFQQIFLLFLGV